MDRHYNQGDGTYPLAHTPVTSSYVGGPVRFALALRLDRRDADLTQWDAFVRKPFPEQVIPTQEKERARRHTLVDPVSLTDPDVADLHGQFRTQSALATELIEAAIRHRVPVGGLLFDRWYLSAALVSVAARRKKDWGRLLKENRNVETASFVPRDGDGQPISLPGPHVSVEALVAQIPASA